MFKKLQQMIGMIESLIDMKLYAGEDGAAGGDGGAGANPPPRADFKGLANLPDDILDDPDLIDAANELNAGKDDDSGKGDAGKPDDSAGDDDAGKGDDAGDDADNDDGMDDDAGKGKDKKDDAGDAKEDDDITLQFDNDVQIGDVTFGKDILAKTPVEVVESLGKLKEKLDAVTTELTETKSGYEKNLEDPIIKDRLARIKEGKADQPYSSYGISKETNDAVTKALDEAGLTEEDIGKVMELVKKEVAIDVEDNVQAYIKTAQQKQGAEVARERIKARGQEILKEVAGMHKSLTPEKVREWCMNPARKGSGEKGNLTYGDIAAFADRFGSDALYAAIAKEMKLPVVMNAEERDKKIIQSDRERLLAAMGAKSVKAMGASQKAKGASAGKPGTVLDDGVIDDEKLGDLDYAGAFIDNAVEDDDIFAAQKMIKSRVLNKK